MTDFRNPYRPIEERLLFRPISERIAERLKNSTLGPLHFNLLGFFITLAASLGIVIFDGSAISGRLSIVLLLYFAFLADKIDGDLARIKGVASGKGIFLDSFLDRLGELALFTGALLAADISFGVLVGLTFASPLLFYYHQVAANAYLGERTLLSRGEEQPGFFSYNRAKHFLIFMILVAIDQLPFVFLIFPLLLFYTLILFLKRELKTS